MTVNSDTEDISCLYCNEEKHILWAEENSYKAVKCVRCGLIYVNPRPKASLISEVVKTGVHSDVEHGRTAISRRAGSKLKLYKKIISSMFSDVCESKIPITWLDVGAGYGEFVEAVSSLAPFGSRIGGLEPMKPKVDNAKKRGLNIHEMNLSEVREKYNYLSLMNVFSHIPDFRKFLNEIKRVLTVDGELFIETGNTADLLNPSEVPGDLDLPDHLVFAGERNIIDFLTEAGFSVIYVKKRRVDDLTSFSKNIVKKLLGRKIILKLPYTSQYRTLLIRAKLLLD